MTLPADWPRPLALLVTLLRGDDPLEDAAALAHGLSGADWETLVDLAIDRHRVGPVLTPVLRRADLPFALPEPVRTRLDAAERENAMVTLAHIAETRRIRAALAAEGIDLAVFKGWPLAERLYGTAAGRHSGDLDILVPEDRVADSRGALEGIGFEVSAYTPKFRRRVRGLDNPQLILACKDIEMYRPETGLMVEVHWQMLNYHGWPTFVDRPGALIRQQTGAGSLLTPDDLTNLMYLSTHGALHLWDRLKWLTDIAVLARSRGAGALAGDLEIARETGVERPVRLALSLAGGLLGSPCPAGMEAGLPDPATVGLERWILARMGRPFSRPRYQAGIRWMGLRLARDWRQRLGILGYDTIRRLRLLALDLEPRAGAAGGKG